MRYIYDYIKFYRNIIGDVVLFLLYIEKKKWIKKVYIIFFKF